MIVATAGHVDHGKTLLVKMLTGMDTDRLEEEKRRGLSINLGFAYRKSGNDNTIAFIDVPGHMRFINNMIAGINGIDLGMLVVAADDGPMPQTREHMDILTLLGVKRFLLVISKIDRVDETRIRQVREAALGLFPDSTQVPVFEVNTPEREGMVELEAHLEVELSKFSAKSNTGYFRLSIDRAFHIKGSGLIVTGTVASGSVRTGDTLLLLPQNVSVRVRTLQVQEQEHEQACAGQRCALNISGDIGKDDIERGDWLLDTNLNQTTKRFDARVSLIEHKNFSLKHMSPVKLYLGAKRVSARMALLDEKKLSSGQTALAQLLVSSAVHCCYGDRFLLRDDSESETLGGGIILDPLASVAKRSSLERLLTLEAMQQETAQQVLVSLLFELKQLVNLEQFRLSWNIRVDEADDLLALAKYGDKVKLLDIDGVSYAIDSDTWNSICDWVNNALVSQGKAVSNANEKTEIPLKNFLSIFKKQFPAVEPDPVLRHLHSIGSIILAKDSVASNKQQQDLPEQQQELWNKVEEYLLDCGLQVPVLSDVVKKLACPQKELLSLYRIAVKEKWLIKMADNRFILVQHFGQFAEAARTLADKQHFSVADFKNSCGVGRNLAVEVLEYFDRIGFTHRKESGRVILRHDRVETIIK